MKVVLFVCFVAFVIATPAPRIRHVQETVHEIARSVKSSDEYSLEEKRVILANLKEMNKDAKQLEGATGEEKKDLQRDLKRRMASLKEEMHEEASKETSKDETPEVVHHKSLEEEEKEAAQKVAAVHDDIKAVKQEIKSKIKSNLMSKEDKKEAKSLVRELESQYTQLAHQTTKSGRKEVAIQMKGTTAKLRDILNKQDKAASLEEKKQKILTDIRSAEEEYDNKNYDSATEKKIHNQFEKMKTELKEVAEAHQLHDKLHAHLEKIKTLASKADLKLEEEREQKAKEEKKDLEEDDDDKDLEEKDDDDKDLEKDDE